MVVLAATGAALLALGLVVLTVALYGTWRMPTFVARLHAATKASALGTIAVLAASIGTGDPTIIGRAALVAALILLTGTVSSHAIGRAAHRHDVEDGED